MYNSAQRKPWLTCLRTGLAAVACAQAYVALNWSVLVTDIALMRPNFAPVKPIALNEPLDDKHIELLGYLFDKTDLALYRKAFDLQAKGKFTLANLAIIELNDPLLMGALLSQRYLHKDYKASYEELTAWLDDYSDMPEAGKIYDLAKTKHTKADGDLPDPVAARRFDNKAGTELAGAANMPSPWNSALSAWQNKKYEDAAQLFSTVASKRDLNDAQASAAHFWAYRAWKHAGENKPAKQHLAMAAHESRTFYGALANRVAGEAFIVSAKQPDVDSALLSKPAVTRSVAYVAIGKPEKAEEELRYALGSFSPTEKYQVMAVATALNLPRLQMALGQEMRADQKQFDFATYPTPKWIAKDDFSVDPALVYAIARQESAFDPEARSPAGATGIMQLMPSTAEYMIKYRKSEDGLKLVAFTSDDISESRFRVSNLTDPVVNVTLGQNYIHYLQDQPEVKDSLLHMLAAYNAGPGNLSSWDINTSDPLLFIEKIPFSETRQYVKQVMMNHWVYSAMLHGDAETLDALASGKWPYISGRFARIAYAPSSKTVYN